MLKEQVNIWTKTSYSDGRTYKAFYRVASLLDCCTFCHAELNHSLLLLKGSFNYLCRAEKMYIKRIYVRKFTQNWSQGYCVQVAFNNNFPFFPAAWKLASTLRLFRLQSQLVNLACKPSIYERIRQWPVMDIGGWPLINESSHIWLTSRKCIVAN